MVESEVPENGWMTLDLDLVLSDLPKPPAPATVARRIKRKGTATRMKQPSAKPQSRRAASHGAPQPGGESARMMLSEEARPLTVFGARRDNGIGNAPAFENPAPGRLWSASPGDAYAPRRRQIPESDIILIGRVRQGADKS